MPTAPRALFASFDPVPAPKGASTHILQSVRAIASVMPVDLLTLAGSHDVDWPPGVTPLPVAIEEPHPLERALIFGDQVAERLQGGGYAVVHVRSIWEGLPAMLLKPEKGFRIIYEVNALPSVELKYHYPAIAENPELITRLRSQERGLLNSADRILTPSVTTRRFLKRFSISSSRVTVIPNGIDPSRFPATPLRDLPATPLLVYVGTLAPWQGLPFLLAALREVVDVRPARLVIVGPGRRDWRRALEHQIRKLGLEEAVELRGATHPDDIPAILDSADLCIAPLAYTERNVVQGCCPIKILEYMAAGRPIVAARVPPVEEVLRHEETALLYKPDKPRRLSEAILRILDDRALAQALATEAAEVVRRDFTWERHNQAVAQLYRELVSPFPMTRSG